MVTGQQGNKNFPASNNDKLGIVETIAAQNIRGLKSTNKLEDAFYFYDVGDGVVIEEAVIEMAKKQAFDKDAFDRKAKDPTLYARYFNNWVPGQYQVTKRTNDIRKVIATGKGSGVEQVAAEILDTLTQGEGAQMFIDMRKLLMTAAVPNYRTHLGGVPTTMKGVLYALRDMYNHVKCDNDDLTGEVYRSSVPDGDIRIAVTTKVLNLIDVTELANVFNLSKEELFGKLVVVDVDDVEEGGMWYKAVVYDRKAMGHGRRLEEFSTEEIAKGLYTNFYLTTDDCLFYNPLFKACYIDCSKAAAAAKADIVGAADEVTVTQTLNGATSTWTATKMDKYGTYYAVLTAPAGKAITAVNATVGGAAVNNVYNADTGEVTVPLAGGNVAVTVTVA